MLIPELILGGIISWNGKPRNVATWEAIAVSAPWPPIKTTPPTDVLEDADGSLIVNDTGGWYTMCCPTSQLSKPDILGAVYRVRRKGAPVVVDPRGQKLDWKNPSAAELVSRLQQLARDS